MQTVPIMKDHEKYLHIYLHILEMTPAILI